MLRVEPWDLIRSVAAEQDGVVTAVQCEQVGISASEVKRLCRAGDWIRLNRAMYLVSAAGFTDPPPRRSVIRASVLSAGPNAVAVLATAAEVHGIAGLRRHGDVHISVPVADARNRRPTEPGIRFHQLVLKPGDTVDVDGIAVTTPMRTLADLVRRVDRFTAVSLLDSALNHRLIVVEDLDLVTTMLTGRRGARRARPWLAESDARAESPLETRVRLRASDGGVPPDELQYRVRDRDGNIVAIADLAWTRARVVGEADGAEAHDNPVAVFRDRKRQNDIVKAGFVPLRFTWQDTLDPDYIPNAIRHAIKRSMAA
jgi:hypothetical protein